jgi:hypothetical protein
MSANFSVTMIDSLGNALPGLDVDLYAGDGTGSKTGDFTDNGDGTYKITVAASGKYTVKVGGVIQTELQNIYIPADDLLTSASVINDLTTGGTTVPLSAEQGKTLNTTKINVSDIVNDLTTGGTNKPLSAEQGKVLNTTKINISDIVNDLTTGGTTKPLSAEQGKTLLAKIGDLDFTGPLLGNENVTSATKGIQLVANHIINLWKAFTNGTDILLRRIVFADRTIEVSSGSEADSLPVYLEASINPKVKVRCIYNRNIVDNALVLTGQLYHIPPSSSPTDTARVTLALYYDGVLVDSTTKDSAYTDESDLSLREFTLQLNTTGLEIGRSYEVRISLNLVNGASSTTAAMSSLILEVRGGSGE